MCYDAEYRVRAQLKRAIHDGLDDSVIEELKEELFILTGEPFYTPDNELTDNVEEWPGLEEFDYHHTSGFSNPVTTVFPSLHPMKARLAHWGFIAPGVKTTDEAYGFKSPPWMRNLNAQSEKIFESRVFSKSAKYGRCVTLFDAYYEHHDYKGKKYPFKIYRKDGKPLFIASICRKVTLANDDGEEIVYNAMAALTCQANPLLQKIHNNPKMVARSGHRMLVILEEEQVDQFLKPYPTPFGEKGDPAEEKIFEQEILNLCQPFDEKKMDWHTVRNLKNRKEMPYLGNVPEISEEFHWENLDYSQFN